MTDAIRLASATIFDLTYGGIALGRIPGLLLDRTGIALLGAASMLAAGLLTPEETYRAIDLDTITMLPGMMIIVAPLRLSGFSRVVNSWTITHAHSPTVLPGVTVLTTGVFSAFLVNDTVCLVMAPLVLDVTRSLGHDPVPYLLATAMGSNAGGVATMMGNPQNTIVGVFSQMTYSAFAAALAPVAIISVALVFLLIKFLCRPEFRTPKILATPPSPSRAHKPQLAKALLVTGGVMAAFFAGVPVAKVAISGAEKSLLSPDAIEAVRRWQLTNVWILTGVTAALSTLVSNVPAVLVLRPFVHGLPDQERIWLAIAMASTLVGNLTLIGSVANLIVTEKARAAGVEIGFWRYLRVGVPVTLATLAVGAWWLSDVPGPSCEGRPSARRWPLLTRAFSDFGLNNGHDRSCHLSPVQAECG